MPDRMSERPKDPAAPTGGPVPPKQAPSHPGRHPPKDPQPGRFDLHKEGHRQGPGAGKTKRLSVPGKGRGR